MNMNYGIRSNSESRKVWKFAHREDEFIITSILGVSYKSENGFLEIHSDGKIIVKGSVDKGYAWDGCTPKLELFDFTFGTPDGRFDYLTQKPMTYYASMIHDILYQHKSEIPISRKVADQLFLKILKESDFMWARLYYVFVRILGKFLGKWKTKNKVKDLRIIRSSWIDKAYKDSMKLGIEQFKEHPFIEIGEKYSELKDVL